MMPNGNWGAEGFRTAKVAKRAKRTKDAKGRDAMHKKLTTTIDEEGYEETPDPDEDPLREGMRRKLKALEWMASQQLPVDDWEEIEGQIESHREACGEKQYPQCGSSP
jgi:hypothetical protein